MSPRVWGSKRPRIASNRLEAKQFLMAMIEGAKILKTDEEFSLRVLTKHTRISDRELLKQSYNYVKPHFLRVPVSIPQVDQGYSGYPR